MITSRIGAAIFSLKENSVRHDYLNFTRVYIFLNNVARPEYKWLSFKL